MPAIAPSLWGVSYGLAALLLLGVAVAPAGAVVDFTFTTTKAIEVGSVGLEYFLVDCVVTNTGTEPDGYDVLRRSESLPSGWTTVIMIGGPDGLLTNGLPAPKNAPFVDSLYAGLPPCGFPSCAGPTNFGLNPGQVDTVQCLFTPFGPEGSGYATFTIRSTANPNVFRTLVMGLVTNGVDVLVMDDDGGETLETYYEAAVPGNLTPGTWHRNLSSVTSAELLNFPLAIWFTGAAAPSLDASDRTAISDYLAGGGKLILSGQDVAYDLCDPASPNYSPENFTWYQTRFKTRYVGTNSSSTSLTGVAGDPISNGLNLTIQGGTGANNQTDPDVLTPLPGAGTVWTYGAGNQAAATRILGQGYRAVNLGFGFEAVANAVDRQMILARAFSWLTGSSIGIADAGVVQASKAVAIEPPRPNPFNPATMLAFELGHAGNVELRILGPNGRVVSTLVDARLSGGRHEVSWDGRDAQGREVASGVYLAEISLAGVESARAKLTLVR